MYYADIGSIQAGTSVGSTPPVTCHRQLSPNREVLIGPTPQTYGPSTECLTASHPCDYSPNNRFSFGDRLKK